ncbi:MAG: CPBP family intramembrane metalloprotease [Deltaproteobacteria bacterium]|nr:CPBP family intramembrane metalloprotease [Deltaproteobacteria bacterium]
MPLRLTRNEWILFVVLSLSLGFSLAMGVLETCRGFGDLNYTFPLLALVLFLSMRRQFACPSVPVSTVDLWRRVPMPCLIALVYGSFRSGPSFIEALRGHENLQQFLWPVLIAPISEELLFRGWVYGLTDRLFKGKLLTFTNPFPVAVWVSAISFSLWHIQNAGSIGEVAFQMFYTLFVGLWLGDWRYQSGRIWGPIIGHVLLNFSSVLL